MYTVTPPGCGIARTVLQMSLMMAPKGKLLFSLVKLIEVIVPNLKRGH